MNILITGSNGFIGKHIINSLKDHNLIKVGRSSIDNIYYDFALSTNRFDLDVNIDLVIHLAGVAHNFNYDSIEKYNEINVMGLSRFLNNFKTPPISFVYISSVSVYGVSTGNLINENHELCANDPYGLSKVRAEILIKEWCKINDVTCTILRLPLVVGNNPPGNLGKMIKAINNGYYFNVDGGKAKKSMILIDDLVPVIIKSAFIGGTYNLSDGHHPSFREFSNLISKQLGKKNMLNLPYWFVKIISFLGDFLGPYAPINTIQLKKITSDLTFDDSRARKILGWNPTPVLIGFKI